MNWQENLYIFLFFFIYIDNLQQSLLRYIKYNINYILLFDIWIGNKNVQRLTIEFKPTIILTRAPNTNRYIKIIIYRVIYNYILVDDIV